MVNELYKAISARYDSMPYHRCGNSGVLLPEISLGLWHNFGSVDTLKRSEDLIHYAFDHGIIHYDLANNYGPEYGSAEETFGIIMKRSMKPYRDEMFISTKAGWDMWPGPYGNWGSRKYLMASLNQSLQRMNLDYVDLFYSHRYDPETPLEETLQALVDIVRQGKALYVGISQWPADATKFAIDYLGRHDTPLLIYQGRLNMFDRTHEDNGVLNVLDEANVGFIGFSPLAQGLLTNRYLKDIPSDSRIARGGNLKKDVLTEDKIRIIKRLDDYASSKDLTLAEMALLWVLSHKAVSSVIMGASSVDQMADNLSVINKERLSEKDFEEIDLIIQS